MASPDNLRLAITWLHQAITDHQHPQAKATLSACLSNMMKVQAADHAAAGKYQATRNAVAQRLTGR